MSIVVYFGVHIFSERYSDQVSWKVNEYEYFKSDKSDRDDIFVDEHAELHLHDLEMAIPAPENLNHLTGYRFKPNRCKPVCGRN